MAVSFDIIVYDDCRIEIVTHGTTTRAQCGEILKVLQKHMPDEDFSDLIWTCGVDDPTTRTTRDKDDHIHRGSGSS